MHNVATAVIVAAIALPAAACSDVSQSHKVAVKKSPYQAYVAAGKAHGMKPVSAPDARDNAHFLCKGSAGVLRQNVKIVLHNADDVGEMKAQLRMLVKAYCPSRSGQTLDAISAAKVN